MTSSATSGRNEPVERTTTSGLFPRTSLREPTMSADVSVLESATSWSGRPMSDASSVEAPTISIPGR
jgi:hypothetical protein